MRSSRPSRRLSNRVVWPAVSVLLLALSACSNGQSAAPAAVAATDPTPAKAPPAAAPVADATSNDEVQQLLQSSGVQCEDSKTARNCTAGNLDAGDYYDVELTADCGAQGFFAGVANAKGTPALNVVPTTGSHAAPRATFSQGQLVCVQGIARAGQNPMYYYVVAIPADSVAQCKGNALCQQYGDRPIQWSSRASGDACHVAAPGRYAGNCAQGWVSASALDVFSNGM
ncbi:hypothetical protein NB688_000658 [Xanthomonas sacchari]|uniref:Uncharacterized protein n=1 Tax=Xanthomonas sacchari TaxID=56458 RepID=A0ABT3DTL6_9XANT|nr:MULTISPECIES: hypothetical protein [Xanthomonas]MCW0398844.1 hypothetical protein [Xanthomonas sacchari]MCW0418492.1 hypothetical protein [Xanthomonas sacchari]UYK72449.1 hypothetical protein NG828_20045 [Xanthomonas sacchari]